MDLESTYTEIYTTDIRKMYAGVQQDDVLKGSRGVTKSKSTSAMPPGHGRMFSAANSKTEPDSIHFPSDSILHDFDSLHDSRQRQSCWGRAPPCRDNLRIVWSSRPCKPWRRWSVNWTQVRRLSYGGFPRISSLEGCRCELWAMAEDGRGWKTIAQASRFIDRLCHAPNEVIRSHAPGENLARTERRPVQVSLHLVRVLQPSTVIPRHFCSRSTPFSYRGLILLSVCHGQSRRPWSRPDPDERAS